MNEFSTFFEIGLKHILDIHAYDHLLFIASLLIVYSIREIKSILWIVSAFTIGHAISLVLGLFNALPLSDAWIEFLIPVSIVIMAAYHLFAGKGKKQVVYSLTVLFGLIHGMAYAKDFLIMMQDAQKIVVPLLGFNIGVEIAQIGFGLAFLLLIELFVSILKIQRRALSMFIFGVIFTLSIQLLLASSIW